jgi:hypothetical protein
MNEYESVYFDDYKLIIDDEEEHMFIENEEEQHLVMDDENEIDFTDIFQSDHVWDSLHLRRYRFKPQYWNFTEHEINSILLE